MPLVKAEIRNGRVEVDVPAGWPDGEVWIDILPSEPSIGLRDEDWPTTPEALAKHVALMDEAKPLILSPEEEAAWGADRLARKEREKAAFMEHGDTLRKMWE